MIWMFYFCTIYFEARTEFRLIIFYLLLCTPFIFVLNTFYFLYFNKYLYDINKVINLFEFIYIYLPNMYYYVIILMHTN